MSLAFWLGCTTDVDGELRRRGRCRREVGTTGLPGRHFASPLLPALLPSIYPTLPSSTPLCSEGVCGQSVASLLQALTPGRDRSEGWGASPSHRAVWPRSLLTSGCVPPWTVVLLVNVCSGRCHSLCPGSFTQGHLPCPRASCPGSIQGSLSSLSAPLSFSQTLSRGSCRC